MAEFLLVCWDADNSVSVISRKAKGMVSYIDDRVLYRWGRQGVFEGTVHFKSGLIAIATNITMDLCKLIENVDSKREVEKKAKEMTKNADASDKNSESEIGTEEEKNEATGKRKTDNGIIIKASNKNIFICMCIYRKKEKKKAC